MIRIQELFRDKKSSPALTMLLFVIAVCSIIRTYQSFNRSSGIDFYQFWIVAQVVGQKGTGDIYSPQERQRIGQFFYQESNRLPDAKKRRKAASYRKVLGTYSTPFLYSFFRMFVSGNYASDLARFQLLCLFFFCLLILVLGRIYQYSLPVILAWITFGLLIEPFASDVRVANVNQLQMGLMALFLLVQIGSDHPSRYVVCGFVLGIMLMFKPNQIFIIWMLLISWSAHRKYSKLLWAVSGMTLAIITALIITSLHWGSPWYWVNWLTSIKNMPDRIIAVEIGNYSFARLWLDMRGEHISILLSLILLIISSTFVWFENRASLAPVDDADGIRQDALMIAIGCLIYLLSAPLVWLHYYLATLPMIMVLLRPKIEFTHSTFWWFIMVLTMLGFTREFLTQFFYSSNPHDVTLIISGSTLMLYILAHLEMWMSIRGKKSRQCPS